MNMKICSMCKEEKSLSDFYTRKDKDPQRYGQPFSLCKKCCNRIKKTPEQKRQHHLKSYYGINLEDYDKLYQEQEGKCLICKEWYEQLEIDHCHKGNTLRGLLCGNCNKGLAFFKDNPIRLQNAIEYLFKVLTYA